MRAFSFSLFAGTRQLIISFLLLLTLNGATADETAELYTGEVAVPDQARTTRDRALGRAFENVLVKLSGQRTLPDSVTTELLGSRARSGLQSVTYQQYTVAIDEESEFEELRLQARFDSGTTDDALRFLGLPRWPVERRRLQFIMAIEVDNERRLITTDDAYLGFVATDTAGQRGLPLEVSLQPADGEFDLSWLQEIWGGFTETPLAESRAAGFDGVLLASASQRNGLWQMRWNMAVPDREWTWSIRGNDLHEALADGVHEAANRIAASVAIQPTEQGRWLENVEVANIRSNRDYLRCLEYLQGLHLVRQVQIVFVQGQRIRFQLELSAAPEHLHHAIDRGGLLSLVGASMDAGTKIYNLDN